MSVRIDHGDGIVLDWDEEMWARVQAIKKAPREDRAQKHGHWSITSGPNGRSHPLTKLVRKLWGFE